MHWADALASKLAYRGTEHVIAAGITPSGIFHIGHIREILTGEMIHRACTRAGLDSEFVFIVDSADPLRKVYDFLDPEYERWIGHQLATIPAPDTNGKPSDGQISYSEYFLNPFLESLEEIGVRPRIIDNYTSYAEGKFAESARMVCDNVDKIREIIEQISGRELEIDWFPYNPVGSNGSMDGVQVTGYEWPYVNWTDALGVNGRSDLRQGDGKLPWRIDWPARWKWIGITCEPFGKDHGSSGGSYSTARPISKLLDYEPPMPLTYEWISIKGVGAMSSSGGVSIGPMDVLQLVPPEVLRYLIARSKPSRHLEFDCGMSLFTLTDEFERVTRQVVNSETKDDELSKRQRGLKAEAEGSVLYSLVDENDLIEDIGLVPFRHLVMLSQIRKNDSDVWLALERGGYIDSSIEPPSKLLDQLAKIRIWMASEHFPANMRLAVASSIKKGFERDFDFDVREILLTFINHIESCDWTTEGITECIKNTASTHGISTKNLYLLLYKLILDRNSGPRIAPLLAEIDRNILISLLKSALETLEA